MIASEKELSILADALRVLGEGFSDLPEFERTRDWQSIENAVLAAADAMHDNYPYGHPLYAGQMLKPPHPVARLAYQMALWINPNNHALDGGRASSRMEKSAVEQIASMYDWDTYLGHLTSSGTLANLEALWIAGQEHPGKTVVASSDAHYTHHRLCRVLGLPFEEIASDGAGKMCTASLEAKLANGNIGTIVATLGTTGYGAVDPLHEILPLAQRYRVRVHVDAAYGGYFVLANRLSETARAAFASIRHTDSIAIDPHKHGLQPYGCGCVLFREPGVGRHYDHQSPYTYFSSDELHLGEISLECSRAGAAAVALWATQQALPLDRDGEFAIDLSRCLSAARALATSIVDDDATYLVTDPELDIVVWAMHPTDSTPASVLAQRVFDHAAAANLHLALIEVPNTRLPAEFHTSDAQTVTCLRSCLMKPEHLDALPLITEKLKAAMSRARADL
ncbi:MAG: aminotransferase class I/II-fold pyridoxal phosphate-dependent enzyme [Pseudomonadota bacterium]